MLAAETFFHYSHQLCPFLSRTSALRIFEELSRSPVLGLVGASMPHEAAADPDVAWHWMTANLSREQIAELENVFPGRIRDNWATEGLLLLLLAAALRFKYKNASLVYYLIEKGSAR